MLEGFVMEVARAPNPDSSWTEESVHFIHCMQELPFWEEVCLLDAPFAYFYILSKI